MRMSSVWLHQMRNSPSSRQQSFSGHHNLGLEIRDNLTKVFMFLSHFVGMSITSYMLALLEMKWEVTLNFFKLVIDCTRYWLVGSTPVPHLRE